MHVEIWSDIACPWCYVGKRRFEQALAGFEHREQVEVTWRSFELDPAAPPEHQGDGDYAARLAAKYASSRTQAEKMIADMTAVAAGEGLDFHFERVRSGSTFDAHRILHLGREHGLEDQVKERLLGAYLTDGSLMSDHATLQRLATEAGLPAAEVAATLASGRFADAVRDDERTARSLGISAVPFFVVDRRYGASGAQPPEVLLGLLRRAMPLETVAGGDSCGVDGC